MEVDNPEMVQFSPRRARDESSDDKQVIKTLLNTLRLKDKRIRYLSQQVARYRTQHKIDMNDKLSLQANIRRMKKELEKIKSKDVSPGRKKEIVREILKPFFDDAQINLLIQGSWTKGRNWSIELLTMALTLKTLSNRCYVYLRKKKIIPLPGNATIVRHFNNFKVEPGFLHCVAALLDIKAANLTKSQEKIIGLN